MRPVIHSLAHAANAVRILSGLGPQTVAAVLANSVEMAVAARGERFGDQVPRDPGELLGAEPICATRPGAHGRRQQVPVGIVCQFARAEVEVRFVADDLVRISWGPGEPPQPWALAADPVTEPPGPLGTVEVTTGSPGPSAASAALDIRVRPDGSIHLLGPDGDLLRHELPPLQVGEARVHRHLLRPGEVVSGLGEQASGLALSGRHRLWNRDPGGGWGPGADPLYCVVPVVVGTHPTGSLLTFFENPTEGDVEILSKATSGIGPGRVEARFASGMLRHYVAVGSLSTVLERYSSLTGRAPLPPRWALGYHQSRWGYATAARVQEVARGFRDEGLPLSALYLDIDYMDGYRVFTVDEERFPELGALCEELAQAGTRTVAIVDPGVKADLAYDVYAQGAPHFVRSRDGGVLHGVVWPGRAAFCDFTDDDARRWWSGLYDRLLDQGVGGVWHDMNEPTSFSLTKDQTLPRDARHAAGDHRSCHNVYGLLMAEAGAAALRAARPDRRPFVLSRSGWAGLQRWSWVWTGDAETSWASLRQQVPTVLGLGLSGIPFSGPDVGGFSGTPTDELYVRWLELAVLLPLCRTHCVSSAAPREPWELSDPARARVGALVRFRYRLLPYLYTLAEETTRTGAPLVRPPGWPEAVDAAASSDELLLGDGLLVAPVTIPGARSRRVVLPDGEWAPWTPLVGEWGRVGALTRQRVVYADAPVGAPTVFIRGGTVLPLDDGPYADGVLGPGHEPRLLALHCVPDRSGRARGTLFDDAGDGYGPHRRHRFTLTPGAGGLRTLRWEREGDYPDPERVRVVVHGKAAAGVRADGAEAPFDVRRQQDPHGVTSVATEVECPPFETLELL
jgi:alpha-glucosidase